MAKDFIIAVLVAIIISALIVLSGCQTTNTLPTADKMQLGEVTTPPAGWVDYQKRLETEAN